MHLCPTQCAHIRTHCQSNFQGILEMLTFLYIALMKEPQNLEL